MLKANVKYNKTQHIALQTIFKTLSGTKIRAFAPILVHIYKFIMSISSLKDKPEYEKAGVKKGMFGVVLS